MWKSNEPTEEQIALMNAWKQAIGKEGANIPVDQICALASQFVGNLIALLDHRKYTPDMAMQLVAENIEIGNQVAMQDLLNPEGSA